MLRSAAGPGVDVARDAFAGVRAAELCPDREAPSAQGRVAGIDDAAVARPDADPAQLAGLSQTLELLIDRGVTRGVEVEARLTKRGVEVAADDRLDVLDGRFLGALAERVRRAVRDDDRHDDDDRDGGDDDERMEAGPARKACGPKDSGVGLDRCHGAATQRT
jgi:hypothetical protein